MNDAIRQRAIQLDSQIELIPSLSSPYAREGAIEDALEKVDSHSTGVETREQISSRRIRGLYDKLSSATAPKTINEIWEEIGREENGHRELVGLLDHGQDNRITLFSLLIKELPTKQLEILDEMLKEKRAA